MVRFSSDLSTTFPALLHLLYSVKKICRNKGLPLIAYATRLLYLLYRTLTETNMKTWKCIGYWQLTAKTVKSIITVFDIIAFKTQYSKKLNGCIICFLAGPANAKITCKQVEVICEQRCHTVGTGGAHKWRHVTVTAERAIAFMTDAVMLTQPRWTESRCIYHTVTATHQHSHLSLPDHHHTV